MCRYVLKHVSLTKFHYAPAHLHIGSYALPTAIPSKPGIPENRHWQTVRSRVYTFCMRKIVTSLEKKRNKYLKCFKTDTLYLINELTIIEGRKSPQRINGSKSAFWAK